MCGIQIKAEDDRGEDDDTTLNDVKLFCCTVSEDSKFPGVVGK